MIDIFGTHSKDIYSIVSYGYGRTATPAGPVAIRDFPTTRCARGLCSPGLRLLAMQWYPGIYITGGLGGHGSGGFNDLWISEVLHVKPLGKLEKEAE